jgi:hypothetical protein
MSKIKAIIETAHKEALSICETYAHGKGEIKPEHIEIIAQYVKEGILEFKKPKINKTKGIYYPCLQSEAFKGLTKNTWLKVVRHAMDVYDIDSGLSLNSVASYTTSAWRYGIEPVRLLTPTDLGGIHSSLYKEECDAWEEIKTSYEASL